MTITRRATAQRAAVGFFLAVVVATVSVGCGSPVHNAATNRPATSESPTTRHASASFPIRMDDKRAVAGDSSIVLVGTVLKISGNKPRQLGGSQFPQTQFDVQVVTSLKGGRTGTVSINQMGGRASNGELVLIEGDKLLEVGKIYLLAARFSPEFKWYSVIPVGGTIPVAATTSLARAATSDPLVAEWRTAVANAKTPRRAPANPPPAGQDAPTDGPTIATTAPSSASETQTTPAPAESSISSSPPTS